MITAKQLKARFPDAFDSLSDDLLESIIAEAALEFTEDKWGDHYDIGLYYLSAHIAASTTVTTPGGGTATGALSKRKVGDVELTFAGPSSAFSDEDLKSTPYGIRFYGLRSIIQAGPITTEYS